MISPKIRSFNQKLKKLQHQSERTSKNSFAWLMVMKKLIFDFNNFFGSSYISIFFQITCFERWPDAKKVVISLQWYYIFAIFGQSF